jgi:hypothetical protein
MQYFWLLKYLKTAFYAKICIIKTQILREYAYSQRWASKVNRGCLLTDEERGPPAAQTANRLTRLDLTLFPSSERRLAEGRQDVPAGQKPPHFVAQPLLVTRLTGL